MARRRGGDGEAFWRYSLAFYAQPGVAPALIALQDRDGCEVNLLLFALWLGIVRHRAIDEADVAAAKAAIDRLRQSVVELRGLRRRLHADPDPDIRSLQRRVGALELSAERLVQRRLAEALPPESGLPGERNPEAIALDNLASALGGAAASEEAAALRQALSRFVRRW
jgi:uncharacterized protein (TIGR02444 family)